MVPARFTKTVAGFTSKILFGEPRSSLFLSSLGLPSRHCLPFSTHPPRETGDPNGRRGGVGDVGSDGGEQG